MSFRESSTTTPLPGNTWSSADKTPRSGSSWQLIAILLAAVALRFFYADGQSITFDEYYEIQLAKQNLQEILLRGDGFPPLYLSLIHI